MLVDGVVRALVEGSEGAMEGQSQASNSAQ